MSGAITIEQIEARQEVSLISLSALDRLNELDYALQRKRDARYQQESYQFCELYRIGDSVVVCSEYYYFGKIMETSDDFICPVLNKKIPCYRVKYQDWSRYDSVDRQWVVEYDIIGLSKYKKPVELLHAHFFNQQKMSSVVVHPSGMRAQGLFKLTSTEEEEYMAKFNSKLAATASSQTPVTFKQLLLLP